jgi:hypothetical protein
MNKIILIFSILVMSITVSNSQNDKPIKFFSLVGQSQSQVENTIGKPVKATLVHRGSDSYDGFLYKTKTAEYAICYRNNNALVVSITPILKQSFSEDALFDGGVFDIENDKVSGTFRPLSGKENGIAYFGMTTGQNTYTFYAKNGVVSRAIAF